MKNVGEQEQEEQENKQVKEQDRDVTLTSKQEETNTPEETGDTNIVKETSKTEANLSVQRCGVQKFEIDRTKHVGAPVTFLSNHFGIEAEFLM